MPKSDPLDGLPFPLVLHDPAVRPLADALDWSTLVSEVPFPVLGTKTGRLQTTFRFQARDTRQMSDLERASYLARLHEVLLMLTDDWVLETDWWHVPAQSYPEILWTDPVDWLADDCRRAGFEAAPRQTSQSYLTLSWQPPTPLRRWLRDLFRTRGAERAITADLTDDIGLMQHGTQRFLNYLEPLLLDLAPLDPDALATYLHQGVSWDWVSLRCPAMPMHLEWQLTDTVFCPGQPPLLGAELLQPITIKTWQSRLGIDLPTALEAVPFPCRYHMRWAPMTAQAAAQLLRKQEKMWAASAKRLSGLVKQAGKLDAGTSGGRRDVRVDALAHSQSILDVQDRVMLGQEVCGILSPTLVCWAETQELLEARTRALQGLLWQQGLVGRVEEAGASIAWLATQPGNVHLGQRGVYLETQHLTALLPTTTVWEGVPWNTHLQAPALFIAASDATPFYFTTHVEDLGNMLVLGPTRTGKSGLLGLIARRWRQYQGARVAIYDKDYALKCATVLGGGLHYAFGEPGAPGVQPLGRIDREEERLWALTWVSDLLTQEGYAPDGSEREEIWAALGRVAGQPRSTRTLSLLQRLLQVQRLKPGLVPYCTGGPYAFFDADTDGLDITSDLVCFEMSTLQSLGRPGGISDQPRGPLGPMVHYIDHRLECDWYTGDPVLLLCDEAKWLLQSPEFRANAEVKLKARAKKNVAMLLCCQEPIDLAPTEAAWQAVLNSIPVRVFLPNTEALTPNVQPYYAALGLRESEIRLLTMAQKYRDYLYRSPLGTRLFQLRLDPVERLLCAASTPPELAVLAQLQATTPPAELPQRWLEHWGQNEAAKLLTLGLATRHAERAMAPVASETETSYTMDVVS